ncbi:MAG: hypothetical protein AB1898_27005 [Acidobacteriota bacterium]
MKKPRAKVAAILLLLFSALPGQAQRPTRQVTLCEEVVGLFVPRFMFKVPAKTLARIEIRMCGPGVSETLQLVAWERNSNDPSLIIDTTDFTLVRSFMGGNVFVAETTGGPRYRLFVIVYRSGKPDLALRRVSTDRCELSVDSKAIHLRVTDSRYNKEEKFTFKTDD